MKAALIGLGSMGRNHYRTIKNNQDIDFVAVVEPNDELISDIDVKRYRNVDELIENEKVDFAVIATPTSTHLDISKKFLEKGIHLLVEKPIATNSKDAIKLDDLAHKNKAKLVVGHVERFNPAIQAVLPHLEGHKIIHLEASRLSGYPTRITDVGVKLDLSIHDVDLMNLLSPSNIKSCCSLDSTNIGDKDDDAVFIIKFYDGALATVRTSWLFPYKERKIKILTDKNYFLVDLLSKNVDVFASNEHSEGYSIRTLDIMREDALKLQLESFLNYIKTGELGTLCDATAAGLALSYVEGENNESLY
jgi:UDP-N-acetylglucosamine 3-dehydrogenase